MRRTLIQLILAVALAVGAHAGAEVNEKPLRILFIGNSYTFVNRLPETVEMMIRAKQPVRVLKIQSVVRGGATLEMHWDGKKAAAAIEKGGPWDYVVLQENSRRPFLDPAAMETYALKFADVIHKSGARPVFFLTWARKNEPGNQPAISRAYRTVAENARGDVVPVGDAWAKAMEAEPSLELHQADKSHPAPAGTYLAACMFFQYFTGLSPEGLPAEVGAGRDGKTPQTIPADRARWLQQFAGQSIRTSRP